LRDKPLDNEEFFKLVVGRTSRDNGAGLARKGNRVEGDAACGRRVPAESRRKNRKWRFRAPRSAIMAKACSYIVSPGSKKNKKR